MVDEITVYNPFIGLKIIINRSNALFLLADEGIDWGETASTLNTQSFIDGLGSKLVSSSISTARNISITGWIIPDNTMSLVEKKAILDRVFNPSSDVEITCNGCKITGRPAHSVKYATDPNYNNSNFCKWTVQISCVFPFFTKEKIYEAGYNTDTPLTTSEYGAAIIPVHNSGSFPVGAEFRFSFFGPSFTGTDFNVMVNSSSAVYSQGFRLLNISGDTITVTTVTGNRAIRKDGNLALSLWDMEYSDWVQIPPEGSIYNSSVYLFTGNESGDFSELNVEISFNELYLSVEEL